MINYKLNNNISLMNNLLSIDLHGEDRKSAELLVKQFIDDLWKLKYQSGMIIHGIGKGVLKKQVHETVKKNQKVEKYYINSYNIGCTIIELKKH